MRNAGVAVQALHVARKKDIFDQSVVFAQIDESTFVTGQYAGRILTAVLEHR